MTTNKKCLYEKDHITIYFDAQQEILINDWKGLLTLETVQDGCLNMIRIFKSKPGYKILNNNENLIGSWAVGVDWTSEVWAPQILGAGLQYFAWVHSKENFAQLSADRMVKKIDEEQKDEIFFPFGQYDEAYNWLVKQQA